MVDREYLKKVVLILESHPQIKGARIGFHGDGFSEVLSKGTTGTDNYNNFLILIEDASLYPNEPIVEPREIVQNKTKLGAELKGLGLNLGFTVLSFFGIIGSAAAEVPSAGTSTFLLIASWTGFVTSGSQTVNSAVRTYQVLFDGDSNSLQIWDDDQIYSTSFLIIDALGVLSAVATIPRSVAKIYTLLQTKGGLISITEFGKLSGAQRYKALAKSIKQAMNAGVTEKQLVDALKSIDPSKAHLIVKQVKGYGKSKQGLEAVAKITDTLAKEIKGILLKPTNLPSSIASPIVSGLSSEYVGTANGSVNWGINKATALMKTAPANILGGVCQAPQGRTAQTIGVPKVSRGDQMNNGIVINFLPLD